MNDLPPMAMPLLITIGIAFAVLLSINVALCVIHLRETKTHGKGSPLGTWAWALSCAGLLVPYIAPITLVMGILDLVRQGHGDLPRCRRRPARLALLNSTVALICLIAILGVFVFGWTAGCATRLKYDLREAGRPAAGPSSDAAGHDPQIVWHHAEKEPNLYREPQPPGDLTPGQQKEYLVGYRSGWEDALDDVPVLTVPGDDQLYFAHCPGTVVLTKKTDATRRGERDGAARARIDFNTFCIRLEAKN